MTFLVAQTTNGRSWSLLRRYSIWWWKRLAVKPPSSKAEFLQQLKPLTELWLQLQGNTMITLKVAPREALLPLLPCSFSVKGPDISSWKNPRTCVMEQGWGTCLSGSWMAGLWLKLQYQDFDTPTLSVCSISVTLLLRWILICMPGTRATLCLVTSKAKMYRKIVKKKHFADCKCWGI